MKNKVVTYVYTGTNGAYFVNMTKFTKYGAFSAETECDDADMDINNKWDGYHFAEYKCDMQYFNEKAKRLYERYIGIKNAYSALAQSISEDDPTMVKLRRQMHCAKRDAEKLRAKQVAMKENYVEFTDKVLNQRRKLRKQQAEKNHEQ